MASRLDPNAYSPLQLAYIGDAVYEVLIRSIVMKGGRSQMNKMHKKTSSLVQASAQSHLIQVIMEDLTPEEAAVFKRGRNAKSGTMAKNQSMSDYRRATGFEALMGYLYLTGQTGRIYELVTAGLDRMQVIRVTEECDQ